MKYRHVAADADSPGDSRVAYTLTRSPGLSVNWMRSWFKALSRTCESYEEEWQRAAESVSGGCNISHASIFQPQSFHPKTWIMNQNFFFFPHRYSLLKRSKCLLHTGNAWTPQSSWRRQGPYQVKGRPAGWRDGDIWKRINLWMFFIRPSVFDRNWKN